MSINVDPSSNDHLCKLFDSASNYIRTIAGKLDESSLLYLYGRFKQAKEGPCSIAKPGFFDFQGRKKWESWNGLLEMSKEEAMEQYIEKVQSLDCGWNPDVKTNRTEGFGIKPSQPIIDDQNDINNDNEWFEAVKKDDNIIIQDLLANGVDFNQKDEQGMTALHWACDRGYYNLVKCLIDVSADISCRDQDRQAPLHYAASCGHKEVVELLLENGAEKSLTDSDGMTPAEVADDPQIKVMLS